MDVGRTDSVSRTATLYVGRTESVCRAGRIDSVHRTESNLVDVFLPSPREGAGVAPTQYEDGVVVGVAVRGVDHRK